METVSAVRYRQHFKKWIDGLPFYDSLAQLAYLLVTSERQIEHPLLTPNDSKRNALIVIGSNRGLCGAYNSNVYRLADVHLKMAKRFGRDLDIYAHGNKVVSHFKNKGVEIAGNLDEFEEIPSPTQARKIGDTFIDQYLNGQIGRLSIVYTRFFSVASQKAQTLTLLPVADLIDDLTTRSVAIWPWELNFEDFLLSPGAEDLFDSIARIMLHSSVTGCFLDAALSEHFQRVLAMRSATDNAEEMIDSLSKEYNLARQSQITGELLDIIGGAFN
jgi:F-type H+-transporting ATPase subunit gamma